MSKFFITIVGYYRNTDNYVIGKKEEFKERKNFNIDSFLKGKD